MQRTAQENGFELIAGFFWSVVKNISKATSKQEITTRNQIASMRVWQVGCYINGNKKITSKLDINKRNSYDLDSVTRDVSDVTLTS